MAIICLAISVNLVDAQSYVEVTAELQSFSYEMGDDLRSERIQSPMTTLCSVSSAPTNGALTPDGMKPATTSIGLMAPIHTCTSALRAIRLFM